MQRFSKIIGLAVCSVVAGCATVPDPEREDLTPQTVQIAPQSEVGGQNVLDAARQALAEGDLAVAESQLARLVQAQPDSASAWYNLAWVRYQRQAYPEAEEALVKAIQFAPQAANNYNLYGLIAQGKGDFRQAQQYYRQAIQFDQDFAIAHYNLGLLHDIYFQDMAAAVQHYEQYLARVDDEETSVWMNELKAILANAR